MLFHTVEFVLFLALLVSALALLRDDRLRKLLLVAASYFFYMWWNPWFVLPLLVTTFIDYQLAKQIESTQAQGTRRTLLILSLVANLGLLAYFKYFNFFIDSFALLARSAGSDVPFSTLQIILPVGISFYTFHTMSYTIDVYRREIPACRSPLRFALFITFFPVLVAGPILRARQFLPELEKPIRLTLTPQIVLLALRGLMKKVLIADNVAPFVNEVFRDPDRWPSVIIWMATVGFAIQIYCDFSGYSDIARALARLLGYEIPVNFDRPYLSRNPAEFWHRWHISLSTWLRDYLYIPLGGNRNGRARTYINLTLTMLLGGLWHGASWNFVLWGAMHGLMLAGHRAWREWRGDASAGRLGQLPSWAAFNYCLLLTWIAFRITDPTKMLAAMRKFLLFDGRLVLTNIGAGSISFAFTFVVIAAFALLHFISWRLGDVEERIARWPFAVTVGACAIAAVLLAMFWPLNETPFIYFQF